MRLRRAPQAEIGSRSSLEPELDSWTPREVIARPRDDDSISAPIRRLRERRGCRSGNDDATVARITSERRRRGCYVRPI
jgi:hypothetical protein